MLNYVIFMLNSNDPFKVTCPQNLANQYMLNGALVIEMINNLLVKIRETLVVSQSEKRSNKKKIETWAVKNVFPIDSANSLFGSAKEQESC